MCFFMCTATTEIYPDGPTLSLHDALPISPGRDRSQRRHVERTGPVAGAADRDQRRRAAVVRRPRRRRLALRDRASGGRRAGLINAMPAFAGAAPAAKSEGTISPPESS